VIRATAVPVAAAPISRSAAGVASPRFEPLPRTGLPPWAETLLDPAAFWSGRCWYDTTLAHALPADAEPFAARCGDVAVPLLRTAAGLRSLTTPYTQDWRPLAAPGLDAAGWRDAGAAFGRLLRLRPPVILEAIDPAGAWLAPFLAGLRAAGIRAARFDHTGVWRGTLPDGQGWEGYLAARPSALRHTVERKGRRAARETRFALIAAPGTELEAGIAAFQAVRAGSWKPAEPFPDFDAALMRAVAEAGALRLGVLTRVADDTPLAAQYWLLDQGGTRATVPKLFHLETERAASPGTVLTAMMVRHLITEDRVRVLDFGRGDDAYKAHWVSDRGQLIGLLLADPRHPAGLAALARQAAGRLLRRVR
jgi:hypothetical protein